MLKMAVFFQICDFHHISDVSVASGGPLTTGMRRIALQDAAVWWQVVLRDGS
jgi:hypothetical protein